jgi:hypothetical protein
MNPAHVLIALVVSFVLLRLWDGAGRSIAESDGDPSEDTPAMRAALVAGVLALWALDLLWIVFPVWL